MEQTSWEDSSATSTITNANNQGADCFDHGDYQSALRFFRYSLELCLTKCRSASSAASGHTNVARPRTKEPPSALLSREKPFLLSHSVRTVLPKVEGSSRDPQYMLALEDNKPFVYHKSILRMPSEKSVMYDSVPEETKDRWRAAITVFNCAMVFQRLYATPCSRCHAERLQHLEKSVTLYKQAISLLEDRCDDHTYTTGNAFIDLLWLASLNNVAVILSCELYRHADAQEFLRHLLSRTMSFQATNCYYFENESASSIAAMGQHVDNFFLNSVALLFGGPTVAAAAA